MSKHKKHTYEQSEDFFAQLDFLHADYDRVLQVLDQQKKDIQKLLARLIEHDIPVPDEIIDRYIKRDSRTTLDEVEELPFD